MTDTLIDAIRSLTALMEEESEKLSRNPYLAELPEIAAAKLRLTGRIDAEVARLRRGSEEWVDKLDADQRAALAEATRALREVSVVNASILSRQIELSVEMMAAIAAEARRVSGKRPSTYCAAGRVTDAEGPGPISINARL